MNRCYTESDVIAESRGWNAMSGDNDVVCVLWICVVVGTESYVCDQLPKLPEEPPPIGDCAGFRSHRGRRRDRRKCGSALKRPKQRGGTARPSSTDMSVGGFLKIKKCIQYIARRY